MIFLISWRNIWRNKKRSLIIMFAISFGIWSGAFSVSLYSAMIDEMVRTTIDFKLAHIQLHHPDYKDEKLINYTIDEHAFHDVASYVQQNYQNAHLSKRFRVLGMAASAKSAHGVDIIGVDPEPESKTYKFAQKIREGTFFQTDRKNPVVISAYLAEKLNVKIKSKIVINFQDGSGEIVSDAFRVIGIYKSPISILDETHLFVLNSDIYRILSQPMIHEISFISEDIKKAKQISEQLNSEFENLIIEDWKTLDPQTRITVDSSVQSNMIIIGIIMIALAFGITNTMLMSVYERIREFGVLMAVGMKHTKLFKMIMVETLLISLSAACLGLIMTIITIEYFGAYGLDLSSVSAALESFGVSHKLYTQFDLDLIIMMISFTCITAMLSALYPGIKAVKLNIVNALHHQ